MDCSAMKSPADRVYGGETTRLGRKQYWQRANRTPTGGVNVAHACKPASSRRLTFDVGLKIGEHLLRLADYRADQVRLVGGIDSIGRAEMSETGGSLSGSRAWARFLLPFNCATPESGPPGGPAIGPPLHAKSQPQVQPYRSSPRNKCV